MANSTTNIDGLTQGQSAPEVTVNQAFDAMSQAATYGRRASTTSGLTWGYYGGNVIKSDGTLAQLANGAVALTANATNYVVAAKATGVVSVSTATTAWDDTGSYWRLYSILTGSSTVSSYTDYRASAGWNGLATALVNPMTAAGDLILGGASGVPQRLAVGAEGGVLTVSGGVPVWAPASGLQTINSQSGASYTLVSGDAGTYVRMDNAGANTITVPANAIVAFAVGTLVHVRQVGAGQTTVVADTGVTITTAETLRLRKQHATVSLIKVDTDTWDIFGDLEAAA